MPIYIIAVDEFATLEASPDSECAELVQYITATGRACNVFMIIATQYANNNTIPQIIRSNLQTKICLKCKNASQSVGIIGTADGVKLCGYGDAFIEIDGVPEHIRIQAPLYDDDTVAALFK